MGLCKCPKRKVTNQFCFEHRVNVCEYCMVTDHPKCIVHSYLQWLDDSDYNPVCQLCQKTLESSDCLRLVCYDVLHIGCLNDWAGKLPSNTAPAGYRCPICSSPVFPAPNLVSPIADALRETLSQFPWANIGLGKFLVNGVDHSISTTSTSDTMPNNDLQLSSRSNAIQEGNIAKSVEDGCTDVSKLETENFAPPVPNDSMSSSQHRTTSGHLGISRKPSTSTASLFITEEEDTDENKYRRRSAVDWFSRWLRTFQKPAARHHQSVLKGRRGMIAFLIILAIMSVVALFSYLSKSARDDPLLDPFNNPNIRVQD